MKLEHLAISCGGTGGHFFPGLAIAREFKKNGGSPLLILGGKNAPKQCAAAEKAGIGAVRVSASPPSARPFAFLRFVLNFFKGKAQTRACFGSFRPQALLIMGSFASIPPAFAARSLGIPIFLHDGNARLGKANRFLSRYAKAIALSFPSPDAPSCRCPAILAGMPLRPELAGGKTDKASAVAEINARFGTEFEPGKPLLLVFGGSLGAASLNRAAVRLPSLPGADALQIVHLAGPGKLSELEKEYGTISNRHLFLEAFSDMHILYSAADLVFCRAGGSTVAELAFFGKYALLSPFPFAAENHQLDNARWLAGAGGAEILPDGPGLPERLGKSVSAFLASPDSFAEAGAKSFSLAKPDAARGIIDMIENIVFAGVSRA